MYDFSLNTACNIDSLSLEQKLEILSDAAKYDVACTSSGVDRSGKKGSLGNSCAAGVCHSFAADGRCISLLKILMTNHCTYDCKYCKNRKSNDVPRATFTPDEICKLTIEFYKRNYIEGLFLSSGILKNPTYTMEKICETLRMLREEYHFNGYIHVKAIPGASEELLYSAGLLADRVSINMELPTESSLSRLAPNKTMTNIITPMNQISGTIATHRLAIGKSARMERCSINDHLMHSIFGKDQAQIKGSSFTPKGLSSGSSQTDTFAQNTSDFGNTYAGLKETITKAGNSFLYPADRRDLNLKRAFAPAGQSTQMIIGASNETDLELIRTTQSLYQSFDLKRVFYSAYIPLNDDPYLPMLDTPVPLVREHRLYQADWLLRYYGFYANELLDEANPNFDLRIDPKCHWALSHLDLFPIEINKASYDELLRIPGIGPTGVKRIMSARRYAHLDFAMLKKMGIVLKRAQYFITCNGKMYYNTPIEQHFIRNRLIDVDSVDVTRIENKDVQYQQMSLFSDFKVSMG